MKKYLLAMAVISHFTLVGCNSEADRTLTTPNKDVSRTSVSNTLWHDDKAKMDAFITELMAKMTLEEKIGQMTLFSSDWDVTGPSLRGDYQDKIKEGKVGAVFNAFTASYTRKLQKMAVEETRLGIPLLFGYDVIHGHRTIFPISLGESASWDLDAIELSAKVAAAEASAEGIHWTFAPMVDVARDPRWGRISEGSGEDVYLTTVIAQARIKGFQGDDLSKPDTVLATAKHFAAYGQAQAGRDYHTTDMSDRELRETYLPPFKAAVDAGAASFMTSFNELNGVPASANKYLLQDILRTEWGFEGFVVTDYTSINEMVNHGFAENDEKAGELAVNAGVDMDMQGSVYFDYLAKQVEQGLVSMQQVDKAARRVLEMKYRLGLFEDPYRYSNEEREKAEIYKDENLQAAQDVARKSMVLLKNDKQLLPLSKSGLNIAVIGPLADSKEDLIGSWSAAGDRYEKPISLLSGILAKVSEPAKVQYAKGASYEFNNQDDSGFSHAITIAKQADVIVMAMGEKWDMTGEATSRTKLDLPGNQQALMEQLKALGKPMILVLMNGRPMTIEWADQNVDSILEAWYPGTMGGPAIADVLFGDYNPSGKLPVTFPRNVGQVPLYYNMKNTGRPYSKDSAEQKYLSRYIDSSNTPLYPFGHGLSYTTFAYSAISLDKSTLASDGSLTASVEVTNSGKYDGEEVVQLYIRDRVGSVTRPVKQLKGFEKIWLNKGETKTVSFTISAKDLAFYRQDMSYGAEAGEFDLFIGTSSDNLQKSEFTLSANSDL
ncbi:beta-glucosidase BglX [Aliiglaciecola sp. LCG003]|uniref:beta-glucosidase BglX n=1 Tax=Aliiglaciecola sp. LCG003 TaxID=3053655 RepID=UPI0025739A87|nr:beta-glucosidase BglX [Aliiglaciecola sp. LCG003]WJG08968.1 beta-glucosidase BglX [Aliiglaciecola sp. LCG003]